MQSYQINLETKSKISTVEWKDYQRRRIEADERSAVCCDMILQDVAKFKHGECTVLDIGSGLGFDGNAFLQQTIADQTGHFIGVEPDPNIDQLKCFDEWHCSTLEQAQIENSSVDVAYAFMVLEHIENPVDFFSHIRRVLKDGGVFWGFTINKYCLFTFMSQTMEKLKLKDIYLHILDGKRGEDRYLNYPTFYRANCVGDISRSAFGFSRMDFIPMWKPGQADYYLPGFLRQPFRWMDHGLRRSPFGAAMISVRLEADSNQTQRGKD